jgi:polysaccharide biosynthesis transport protein
MKIMTTDQTKLPPARNEIAVSTSQAYPESAESNGYGGADDPGSGDLVRYWRTLQRHKLAVMLITFTGGLTGVLLTLPQTPIYRARTTLEIQDLNDNFLNIKQVFPVSEGNNSTIAADIETQIRLLQSEGLMKRALAKTHAHKALHLQEPKPSPEFVSVQSADRNLKIRADGKSRIVDVYYDSTDPAFAAALVNTLVQEFIETNLEARWKMSQHTSEWLSRQLDGMRIKLERSEGALQSYARKTGLTFTSENDNISEGKLRQLQEELSKAQASRILTQSRWELTKHSPPEALPDVLHDSSLRPLQDNLTELRRQRAELIITHTEQHSKVKQVDAQITLLEEALEKERAVVVDRLRNDYEAGLRRESLLTNDYATQMRLVADQTEKSIPYNILKRDLDSNRQLYETMLQRVKEASVASAVRASNVRIVDPAEPPQVPYRPRLGTNAVLGLLSGLFIGVTYAFVRARADRTLRAPGEAQFWLNIPELQVIPSARGHDRLFGAKEHNTLQRKASPAAESFRSLSSSVLFFDENIADTRVLVVTSTGPQEGKTTVVSNLGVALAAAKREILIIDGDIRKPRLHEVFALANTRGFSSLLRDPQGREEDAREPIQKTTIPHLFVLTSGPVDERTPDLLRSADLSEWLARLKTEYDFVIIDTPPMLEMSDARVLGRIANGVILITRAGHTSRDAVQAANQRLARDHIRLLGTVLNDWDPKQTTSPYTYAYKHTDASRG